MIRVRCESDEEAIAVRDTAIVRGADHFAQETKDDGAVIITAYANSETAPVAGWPLPMTWWDFMAEHGL